MRRARALLALVAAASLGGCSAVLNFNDCNQDSDCAARQSDGGVQLYCTSDHLCVDGLPEERLCTLAPGSAPASQKPVVIGGLFRLSGAADSKDTSMADAALLAIAEINQTNQRPIALVMCDTAGDQSHAVRAFNRAVGTFGAVAMVGPTTSSDLLAVAPLAVTSNVLVVSPSATSPAITDLSDHGLIWRTCASDAIQSKVLAQQAKMLTQMPMGMPSGALDVAYVNSAYGVGLDHAFIDAWGMTLASTTSFNEGSDPKVPLGKLALDSPVVSVLIADADAAALVASLSTNEPVQLAMTRFLMTDGAKGPDLFGATPNAQVLGRIRGTGPASPSGPVYSAFASTYQDRFMSNPSSTSFVANTYDAFYAVALVIAGTPPGTPLDGGTLAAEMARLSTKPMTVRVGPVDYVKGVSALLAGGAVDLDGTSGPIDFDPATGDIVSAAIEVWDIDVSNPTTPKFRTLSVVTP